MQLTPRLARPPRSALVAALCLLAAGGCPCGGSKTSPPASPTGPTPTPSATTTVYAGEIVFDDADGGTCKAPLRVTFVGDTMQDVDIYGPEGGPGQCDVVVQGMTLPLEKARLRDGRSDGARVTGTLDLSIHHFGESYGEALSWEGPAPSAATGFQGRTSKGFHTITAIHWDLPAE